MKTSKTAPKPLWQKTTVANLVRHTASGMHYARVRVRGKLIWKSLQTKSMSVAKLRLADFHEQENHRAEATSSAIQTGKMTLGDAIALYRQQLQGAQHLKPSAKLYREKCISSLMKTWPGIETADVRKVSAADCLAWAAGYGREYSPTVFNNTVGTLRHLFQVAIKLGARYGNPANEIKKARIRQKVLKLPEHDQFSDLVASVRTAGGRFSEDCGNLIEFLAYSGMRKGEAARVTGGDCSFESKRISVKGDPETGTKNWEIRTIPMIPDMCRLLERIRAERNEEEWRECPVMRIRECQKAIDSACKKLGIARFTHHDLRHLFATRCIESRVDIPTVSRWLGHKDGGALAMKTYGHLRDEHSASMAQRVSFSHPVARTPAVPESEEFPHIQIVAVPHDRKAIVRAKAKYTYPWWASQDPMEAFWGQLHEEVPILPLERFRTVALAAMRREVFVEELSDRQSLLEEFIERTPQSILAKLSEIIQGARPQAI